MNKKLFTFINILMVGAMLLTACSQSYSQVPTPTAIDLDAFVAQISTKAVATANAEGTQFAAQFDLGTPTAVPATQPPTSEPPTVTPVAAQPMQQNAGWVQFPMTRDFDVVSFDGNTWEMPKATAYLTSTKNGRYEAITPPDGQHPDWPPHLAIYRTLRKDGGLKCQLEISLRIVCAWDGAATESDLRFMWAFNPQENMDQLKADYKAAASGGDLGLFIVTKDGLMPPVTVSWKGKDTQAGFGCWDCLANTRGPDNPLPVPLDVPGIEQFGTPTNPLSGSLIPGVVIPIPHPDTQPDFKLDLSVHVPAGTVLILFLGEYDLPNP